MKAERESLIQFAPRLSQSGRSEALLGMSDNRKINDSHRGRSDNFSKAMQRSAEKRRCPKCGRGAALTRISDEFQFGSYCRYEDCGYERMTLRDE